MRAAVVVPDWPLPHAGRWQLHNVARELLYHGIDAVVVGRAYEHEEFKDGAPIVSPEEYEGSEDTVLIVCEGHDSEEMDGYFTEQIAKPNAAVVVYCQGWGLAKPYSEVETHYWGTGEEHRNLIRKAVGVPRDMHIARVNVPVDFRFWARDAFTAKIPGSIAYYPRRNVAVLDKVVRACGAEHCAFRLAGLDRKQLRAMLDRVDIFLLASDNEGQGVALQEAMLMECAVVTWPSGGLVDTVEDGVTGRVVKQGDVGGLVRGVKDLRKCFKANRAMGCAAREFVKENYSWDVFSNDLRAAWLAILSDTQKISPK